MDEPIPRARLRSAPRTPRSGFAGRSAGLLLATCLVAPLASARAEVDEAWGAVGVEEDVLDGSASGEGGVHDPFERLNRGIFAFNDFTDRYLLEPLAIGWDTVMPDSVQLGIDNFFDNVALPRRIVNELLQGKPDRAADAFGRLLINTTFGLGGLFDPASASGLPQVDEDFGQTLGVWGVPPGPYLMLPLLGPSSPRDATGLAVEAFALSPEFYFLPYYVSYPVSGTRLVNTRSLVLETVRAERESAFDFYASVRSAYVQFRANQVRDRADDPEVVDDDLYYFDEDEDLEDADAEQE